KVDPALRAILDHAALLAEGDALELGYSPDTGAFSLEYFGKPANLRKFEDHAARYYGAPKSVRIQSLAAGDRVAARSQADLRERERAERARAHEARVRSHEAFETITREFPDGRVTIAPPEDDA
ncbi:MAG: hypothetical protein KC466_06320, partial [Myxococcales bacterium]|nr:hypothetical protein [Myxococcales bacterium]